MKQGKRMALAVVTMACLLCSCNQATAKGETTDTTATTDVKSQTTALVPADLFSDRDRDATYVASEAVTVTLNSTKATTSDSKKVSISGSTVTIQEEGVYVLSGKLTNGQIIIDAKDTDKVQLVLNGVTMNSNTSAAIYVRQADKVFVTLAKGSTNTLSNKNEFVAIDDNKIDGVVFAKSDLTFNGSGTLTINAAYGSGVVAKDDLTVTGGIFKVTAAEHGFDAKDSICIADGTFQVTATKDGFHSENSDDATKGFVYIGDGSYTITAQGDGFDAAALLQIDDGTFQIKTGGGSDATLTDEDASAKGFKAGGYLLLTKGSFTLNCADDAVHTNGNITVKNGTYTIATGDDGFHADLAAVIENGTIHITKCYEGIEGETVLVSAGTINIVSSDDGLNAAQSGENTNDAMNGQQPGGVNGEMTEFDPTATPPEKPAADATTSATTSTTGTAPTGTAPTGTAPTGTPPTGTDGEMKGPMGGGFAANENCDITITGGTLTLDTKGDSIDSNGSIHITGGVIYITGPENNGNSCVDSDGDAVITGGTLVACGSSSMFNGFSADSKQAWALFHLTEAQSGKVTLKNGNTTVLSYTPTREYTAVLVSGAGLKDGSTYTITIGDETQTFTMDGTSYTSGTATTQGMGGRGQMGGTRPDKTKSKTTTTTS